MKYLLSILLFISLGAVGQRVYSPSVDGVPGRNQPIGMNGLPVDGRSMYRDTSFSPAKWRDFQSPAEAISYFNTAKKREGGFTIFVRVGGTLSAGVWTGGTRTFYSWKDGVLDNDLIPQSALIGNKTTQKDTRIAAVIDTVAFDDFDGDHIDAQKWTRINDFPDVHDIITDNEFTHSVSGGSLNLIGQNTLGNFGKLIAYTGLGKTTLRNYKFRIDFKINAIGANSYGPVIGFFSTRNVGQNCSSLALPDMGTAFGPGLTLAVANDVGVVTAKATSTTGIPTISTTNEYRLTIDVNEDSCFINISNLTLAQSKTVKYRYDFTNLSQTGTRPNIGYPAIGVNGNSDISIRNFLWTTTEKRNPDIIFIGNSITTGYYSGSALNAFPYKLRDYTSRSIQIMAGGYNRSTDIVDNIPEILRMAPKETFVTIGTNDGGAGIPVASTLENIKKLHTALNAEGIRVTHLMTPDGGNPTTPGTLNYLVKNAFPNEYIDNWTTGWNTMNIGNGEMVDTVHPTNTGMTKITNIIRAARPDIMDLFLPLLMIRRKRRRIKRKGLLLSLMFLFLTAFSFAQDSTKIFIDKSLKGKTSDSLNPLSINDQMFASKEWVRQYLKSANPPNLQATSDAGFSTFNAMQFKGALNAARLNGRSLTPYFFGNAGYITARDWTKNLPLSMFLNAAGGSVYFGDSVAEFSSSTSLLNTPLTFGINTNVPFFGIRNKFAQASQQSWNHYVDTAGIYHLFAVNALQDNGEDAFRIKRVGAVIDSFIIPRGVFIPDDNTLKNNFSAGAIGIQSLSVNEGWIWWNHFYNGTNVKYKRTGFGAGINHDQGSLNFYTTPSGTAGANATTTNRFKIKQDGTIQIFALAGVSNRMVVADASGNISTQAIPSGGGGSTDTTSLSNRISKAIFNVLGTNDSTLSFVNEAGAEVKSVVLAGFVPGGATVDTTSLSNRINGKANTSHTHAATDLTTGLIPTARFGSGTVPVAAMAATGTLSSSTYLRGDGTWSTPAGSPSAIGAQITDSLNANKTTFKNDNSASSDTLLSLIGDTALIKSQAFTATAGLTINKIITARRNAYQFSLTGNPTGTFPFNITDNYTVSIANGLQQNGVFHGGSGKTLTLPTGALAIGMTITLWNHSANNILLSPNAVDDTGSGFSAVRANTKVTIVYDGTIYLVTYDSF